MSSAIIVIPCFNEEKRLEVLQFQRYALQYPQHSFLFVNDGSSDRTALILDDLKDFVLNGASAIELKREAIRLGMMTLRMSSLDKMLAGDTTYDEVIRCSSADQ